MVPEPKPKRELEADKLRRIEGIAECAYWVGTPITGALYVLQGNNFVRIGVGDVGEESVRIEKSAVLARAVVKRLRSHLFITPLGPCEQTIRRIRRNNFQLINSAKRPVHDRLLWGEKLPMLT